MKTLLPVDLACRQMARDRRATATFSYLLARKVERMRASAFGFLRGSAPLFYEILDARPDLASGPPGGEGWIVGDLHVENFGAYRPEPLGSERERDRPADRAVFGLNDFDDATLGPWRFDLLRLATSLLLAARGSGVDGVAARSLLGALFAGYGRGRALAPPPSVTALVQNAVRRSRRELLEDRTELVHGRRRFLRGERYRNLPPTVAARARRAFADYVKALGPVVARVPPDAFEVVDVAFRIAGTGSLGSLHIAVLVAGKGGAHGHWIFDMKEEHPSSAETARGLVRPARLDPAARVLSAMQALLEHPLRMAQAARLGRRSMLVRRLTPQEDRLDLGRLSAGELEPLARHLGGLTGAAHRRAVRRRVPLWSTRDRARLVDAAVELAGLHEAAYLAYCGLAG